MQADLCLRLRHRRIRQVQKRRLDQRRDDEHVHRRIAREAGVADFFRQPEPAINLHGAGVAALHLGQELRRVLLLDQDAAHATPAEVDRERQADRAGADNDDLVSTIPLASCAGLTRASMMSGSMSGLT